MTKQHMTLATLGVALCAWSAVRIADAIAIAELDAAAPGLVAAYNFDEGAGTRLNDLSGNANHGVISGAAWTATAKYGGALTFDGIDDLVTIADAASLDLTSATTLEAWVRPTSTTGWRTVVLKEVPSELAYSLYANSDVPRPSGWIRIANISYSAVAPSTLALNTWTHVATTYDGAALRIFVNGTQVASTPRTGSMQTSANPLRIGGNLVWGEYFRGELDEVRIYNRALASTEIQADMNSPIVSSPDTASPNITMTAPAAGTVSNVVAVSASASDDVGVAGVQFLLNDAPLANEDTAAPYSINWDTRATANGDYRVSARARDAAGNTGQAVAIDVIVSNAATPPPPPDFTIAGSPASRTVTQGGSTSYTVTIGATDGFTGTVTLTASGLPAGAAASFSPASVTFSGSATLNITTAGSMPAGRSTLAITGTSGSLNHTTTVELVVGAATAAGRTIGIDFVGTATAMAATESAGVVAKANWNSVTGATRSTPLALKDDTGAATGATVTWRSDNTWRTPITVQAGNRRMMKGYLDNGFGGATTVTVAGLASDAYDVYVYVDGDNGSGTRTGEYTISGAGITTSSVNATDPGGTNFNATFTLAANSSGNYVKFTINASAFTLTATPGTASDGRRRAPMNGIQIVSTAAAPPPPPAPAFSVSGAINPAAVGASSKVDLGGDTTATTTAAGTGTYSFTGLPNGAYAIMPSKAGVTFTPTSRHVTVAGADVPGVDFTAAQSPITVSITSPANGATVSSPFSIAATTSGAVAGVQFRVNGANAGPEDTTAPYSVSVTAPAGGHTLTAVAREAAGGTVTSAPVNVTVSGGSGTALTINGAQVFQTIDGFGVNMNSLSWKNGELRPAIDLLVDSLGATLFRVVFDMEDWEDPNDDASPANFNWTYYNALYSNAKFQNLWGTLRYLNQKGVTTGIAISFMGRVPPWMGGSVINAAAEDEWVEMMASLFFYARNTENVQFDMIDPLNEPDWDGLEGPQVAASQYVRVLEKLSARLDAIGLGALRFLGPNTAAIGGGVNTYMPAMMASGVLMSKLDHFALHNYAGDSGGADAAIKGSSQPSKNFWITEVTNAWDIMTHLDQNQNPSAALVWDAYDSVYNHAILAGRGSNPPNDVANGPPLLSYSTSTGAYTPREGFHQVKQIFKFVSRGSVRIAATESNASLQIFAFRHQASGRVTIVGRNTGAAVPMNASMSGVAGVTTFQLYHTSGTTFFQRGADVVVTSGSFSFTAPGNSFFTLTTP